MLWHSTQRQFAVVPNSLESVSSTEIHANMATASHTETQVWGRPPVQRCHVEPEINVL